VALQRPGIRFYVIESERMLVDTQLLGPALRGLLLVPPSIGHLTIPVTGSFVARREREVEIDARSALVDPALALDERWEGAHFRALCVDWDAAFGPPGRTTELRLSARESSDVANAARAIVDGTLSRETLQRLTQLLVSHAVLDEGAWSRLREPAPPNAHVLARAVNKLFTRFDLHPDLGDLERELGVSPRHIRRTLTDLGPWSVLPGASMRAALRRYRTWLAPSLSTAEGATVEAVAQALGYRSPSALLLALRDEGVPAPSHARAIARGASHLSRP